MKTLENYSPHPFQFPLGFGRDAAITVPGGKLPLFLQPVTEPGRLDVEDEIVSRMQGHPVARGWFGPGGLVVKKFVPPAPPAKTKAAR